jgi:hypothetical protein
VVSDRSKDGAGFGRIELSEFSDEIVAAFRGLAIVLAVTFMFSAVRLQAQETQPTGGTEKVAKDFNPAALWDGRQIMPFRAVDYPRMVPADQADFLDDSEYVLALTVNGESRAYPTRFVWWHHIVNDKGGKSDQGGEVPFIVTYCSVCNTGIRYDPVVDGKLLHLDFYGLYNGVVALMDRETESVWPQAEGRAVKGPLSGTELKIGTLLDTTWGQWKKLHPDTLVMSPEGPFAKAYRPKGQAEPRGYDRFPAPFFKPTVSRGDKRIPPFDKVLGVALRKGGKVQRRAYPIKSLIEAGGVVNDKFGGENLVAFLDLETLAATAASRTVDGKTLTFEARKQRDGKTGFYDKETGTRWSIEGRGEEGPLAGKTLTTVENHLSQWYGWAAFFPNTSIYGRKDPPQPGNPFDEVDTTTPPAPKNEDKQPPKTGIEP